MKKIISTLLCTGMVLFCNATTYYWVGGLNYASSNSFTNGANWTTDPVLRVPVGGTITVGTTDIFIYDGSNMGSDPAVPVTGPATIATSALTATPISGLKFINGANITLVRIATGTSGIPVNGDGTASPDFVIDATSTFTMGGPASDYNVTVLLGAAATGSISGTLYLGPPVPATSYHTRSFVTAAAAGSLTFESGSNAYVNDSTAVSPWNNTVAFGIIFKSGANLYYNTGRSPIGSSSTLQYVDFQPGSNLYILRINRSYLDNITAYTSSSWTNNKYFGNIYVQNGATFIGDGPVWRSDNINVATGSTFTLHSSGQTGMLGNLTVDGTLNAPALSTNNVVFGGDGTQTVSGSGVIDVPVITNSAVTTLNLQSNINLVSTNTSNIFGTLNFGSSQVSGAGAFSARGAVATITWTGNTTSGSYQITNAGAALSSLAGLYVTGPGIQNNTVVLAFSGGGGTINLSKPVTAASTGGSFNFFNIVPATLKTASTGGIDGSVTAATKNFSPFTSYTFDINTLTPFPATAPDSATNITINNYVTTNRTMNLTGTLTLTNGLLTIRDVDSIKLRNSNPVAGGPFSNSKYIITNTDDVTGAKGVLMASGVNSSYLFPVGDPDNYLPVTVSPSGAADYYVTSFGGITQNGQPNGTPFTAAEKSRVVDAVWIVNRSANPDPTTITVGWPQALEGASFSTVPGALIGVARYDGAMWQQPTGSGDNTNNTATANYSTFSPFAVGQILLALPVKLTDLSAQHVSGQVKLQWNVETEQGTARYDIERSADGINFAKITSTPATGSRIYTSNDIHPLQVAALYRVKIIDNNGKYAYSNVVRINLSSIKAEISIYPNPVQNRNLNLDLINLEKGSADIVIYNMEGKVVLRKTVQYDGGVQKIEIALPSAISRGAYRLLVVSGQQKLEQRLMVD